MRRFFTVFFALRLSIQSIYASETLYCLGGTHIDNIIRSTEFPTVYIPDYIIQMVAWKLPQLK